MPSSPGPTIADRESLQAADSSEPAASSTLESLEFIEEAMRGAVTSSAEHVRTTNRGLLTREGDTLVRVFPDGTREIVGPAIDVSANPHGTARDNR